MSPHLLTIPAAGVFPRSRAAGAHGRRGVRGQVRVHGMLIPLLFAGLPVTTAAPSAPGSGWAPRSTAPGQGVSVYGPGPRFVQRWVQGPFPGDQGAPIALSSPVPATLDPSGPAVVVGDRSGYLYAFHLDDGSTVPGWPVYDGGAPIDSTPSVADLGGSALGTVFVGEGNASHYGTGGYEAFGPTGLALWRAQVGEPASDAHPAYAVQASLTVTDLQGTPAVFAGSLGQEAYALNASSGATLPGFPFFSADSVFSTAAAADLYGNGATELVLGGASTRGFALGQGYHSGGHLRVLSATGSLVCHHDLDQEVDSSPAVGPFLSGGTLGVVVGTGSFYSQATDSNMVYAFGTHCNPVWSARLDGFTGSGPALADLTGNGQLDVVEGTDNGAAGSVWALDGADGRPLWHVFVGGRVIGGVVTADLSGHGYQDVLVPTTQGVYVLDGRNGFLLAVLAPHDGFQGSPLVTDDADGLAGVTVAGYTGANEGVVAHYEVLHSNGAAAVGPGAWPMFHHDPQLSGTTGTTGGPTLPACDVPSAAEPGYQVASADGSVSSFGQPACGSAADVTAGTTAVAITMSPAVGGYWMALADGAVLAFGAARDLGSLAGRRLAAPVTAMAATPDGNGYWLASADGGVFAFGDAAYMGSPGPAGGRTVAVISSPDGQGYLVVTADGAVHPYGDARYHGSMAGRALTAPIVAAAEDPATGGYWLLGADGGVFAFGAPYEGAATSSARGGRMVAIAATADGRGYWVASQDGAVLAFGDAPFLGSVPARGEPGAVTAMAGSAG